MSEPENAIPTEELAKPLSWSRSLRTSCDVCKKMKACVDRFIYVIFLMEVHDVSNYLGNIDQVSKKGGWTLCPMHNAKTKLYYNASEEVEAKNDQVPRNSKFYILEKMLIKVQVREKHTFIKWKPGSNLWSQL
jgi:hypothetical protein